MGGKQKQVIMEWIVSTESAIEELEAWRLGLVGWFCLDDDGASEDDLARAFQRLCQAGLGKWADTNPTSGGLNVLAAAVCGKAMPHLDRLCQGCQYHSDAFGCEHGRLAEEGSGADCEDDVGELMRRVSPAAARVAIQGLKEGKDG